MLVTHFYDGAGSLRFPSPIGVYYVNSKWAVYAEDQANMPVGAKFNVLVINR